MFNKISGFVTPRAFSLLLEETDLELLCEILVEGQDDVMTSIN